MALPRLSISEADISTGRPDLKSVGGRIKHARLRAVGGPLTQEGLSKLIGAKQGTVSDWETGKTVRIGAGDLQLVAKHTGFPEEWLRDGGPTPVPSKESIPPDDQATRITDLVDACVARLRKKAEGGLVPLDVVEEFMELIAHVASGGRGHVVDDRAVHDQ